jgi:hypothetical protein
MSKKLGIVHFLFISLLTLLLSGCATPPPPASTDIENYYKFSQLPPQGYGRVYVLCDDKLGGQVLVGPSTDKQAQAGSANSKTFAAFDAKAGSLLITYEPYNGNFSPSSQSFEIVDGKTIAMRPEVYMSGASFGLIGSLLAYAAKSGNPEYQDVALADAMSAIQSKSLSSISPEAEVFVQQKM